MRGATPTRIEQPASAEAALQAIGALGRRVVTFLGFSDAGYEDEHALRALLAGFLDTLDPAADLVSAGATPSGIGAVYALAAARGFTTIGIVSSLARAHHVAFAPEVDVVYVIDDLTWGGLCEDGGLSPTSAVTVAASDELVCIGGGAIARDEYCAAQALGKRVRYAAAQMNHAREIEKARKSGAPTPASFHGAMHDYLTRR